MSQGDQPGLGRKSTRLWPRGEHDEIEPWLEACRAWGADPGSRETMPTLFK